MIRLDTSTFRRQNHLMIILILIFVLVTVVESTDAFESIIPAGTIAHNTYGGASFGGVNNNAPDVYDDGSVTGIDADENDVSFKVYGGYQFNPYISVEATYQDFGESTFNATSNGKGDSWAAGSVSARQEAEGYGVSTVGRYPVTPRLTLFGKLGWFWWKSKEEYMENINGTPYPSSVEESGNDYTYGAGIEYDVGNPDRFVYRVEVEHHEVGKSGFDVNSASMGIVYKFP